MKKDVNFGDCTTCKHSLQVAEHEWDCMATEYDIDTKSCWEKRNFTKTKEFKFRLTEKEFEEMRELAEQEGRTMSNLLRYLVAKERKERENK